MKRSILFFLLSGILLQSCKKDDVTNGCELSSASITGTYKLSNLLYKANESSPELSKLSMIEPCLQDDLMVLNPNNTITYTDAGSKCNPGSGGTGTWSLNGNTIDLDGGDLYTVTSFDCNSMTLMQMGSVAGECTKYVYTRN